MAEQRLKQVVMGWGIMGAFGVPFFVYFDVLGGWKWVPHNAIYEQMIVSIYISIGSQQFDV